MIAHQTRLFMERELALSLRARWFTAYSLIFLAGGMLVAAFGLGDTLVYGYRGFAKAIAGLVHVSLLIVPVMVLIPAIATIADERERVLDRIADVTRATSTYVLPSEDVELSVARVFKELPNRTRIGAIAVGRLNTDNTADNNWTYAVDGRLGIGQAITFDGYVAQSSTPGRSRHMATSLRGPSR